MNTPVDPAVYDSFLAHLGTLMSLTTAQAEVIFRDIVDSVQAAPGDVDINLLFPDAFDIYVTVYDRTRDSNVALSETEAWLALPPAQRVLGGRVWIDQVLQRLGYQPPLDPIA